jgi:hypothetical protein
VGGETKLEKGMYQILISINCILKWGRYARDLPPPAFLKEN